MSRIVFLSHTPQASTFRVGSHHLAQQLASTGHEVAHISTPLSLAHTLLGRGTRERREAARHGVHRVGAVIELIPRPVLPADVRWSQGQYDRILAKIGFPDVDFVFVDQPLFAVPDYRGATVILRPTDIFPSRRLQRLADEILGGADGVVATSRPVLEQVARHHPGLPSLVLENGVDVARFSGNTRGRTSIDFVYAGALDARFDFEGLAHLAAALPERSFEIYGPIEGSPPRMPANVTLHGPIPYDALPDLLGRARVGLLPFTDTPLNAGRSPMKLYEYVAAGLAVLGPSKIAERVPGISAIFSYTPGGDRQQMEAAARAAIEYSGPSADDREILDRMDWANVASALLAFAESVHR